MVVLTGKTLVEALGSLRERDLSFRLGARTKGRDGPLATGGNCLAAFTKGALG